MQITLLDGKTLNFDQAMTAEKVAHAISPSLAKRSLAAKVDGRLVDLNYEITQDCQLQLITTADPEGLEILRHSCAHLLAQAVKRLYPEVQVTIGPVIEDGFYYDFYYPAGFHLEDLPKIEKMMQQIAAENLPVKRMEMPRDEAIRLFEKMGEHYKVKIIQDIPQNEILSLYQQGEFIDLCRGPHTPSTASLKAFKLTKLAGAYWRGDANNEVLQRIYGTAWPDQAQLDLYLKRIKEAEERDHRLLAKKMDLFHLQDISPGMVFWHANGWTLYRILENYIREQLAEDNYQEIRTPQVVNRILWEKSGHWEKFGEEMFTTESEKHQFAIKPMSCPCHVQVFNQGLKSYRDLPIRFSEFGSCHRNEPSGTLHGLMRVRHLVQDDGHIFCLEEQVRDEARNFIQRLIKVYQDFGFKDIIFALSTRPEKRIGSDALWDRAENDLAEALKDCGLNFILQPGEGAFYGPKIEFKLRDCLNRIWQCGTLQLDFFMPERLEASYVAADSSRKTPVMLHRAIFGSLERFMGILLEHYAGLLPLWLAPVQVVICTITDSQADWANQVGRELNAAGIRTKTDLRNEKIGYKIREHAIARVPYHIVIGDREVADKTIAIRTQSGKNLGVMKVDQFLEQLKQMIAQKQTQIED